MARSLSPMKKAVLVAVSVVLAPVLLVGVVAMAAGDWRDIGATAGLDQALGRLVSASRHNRRTAWVRVEYKEPANLPQGGSFVELRARVHLNCASGRGVTNSEW